jgi:predicted component of type VI protein secretion system
MINKPMISAEFEDSLLNAGLLSATSAGVFLPDGTDLMSLLSLPSSNALVAVESEHQKLRN